MHTLMLRKALKRLLEQGKSLAAQEWNVAAGSSAAQTATKDGTKAASMGSSGPTGQLTPEAESPPGPPESGPPPPAKVPVAEKPSGARTKERELRLWHSSVGDVLSVALDAKSELVDQFRKVKIDVGKGDPSSHILDVCDIISRAVELTNLTPSTASDRQELRHEVQSILTEKYFAAWWIRVPGLLLLTALAVFVGTAALAIFGAIKISDQELSVEKLVDGAKAKINADMTQAHDQVKKDLDAAVDDEKKRIHTEAENEIEALKGEPLWLKVFGASEWASLGASVLALLLAGTSMIAVWRLRKTSDK